MDTDPRVLDTPLELSQTIRNMMDPNTGAPAITPAEAKDLASDVKTFKSKGKGKSQGSRSRHGTSVHGEGNSGEGLVPDYEPEELADPMRDPLPPLSEVSSSEVMVDDPPSDRESEVREPAETADPLAAMATLRDLDDMSEGIDKMFVDLRANEISAVVSEQAAQAQIIRSLRKTITSLTEKVNSLQVKLDQKSVAVPLVEPPPTPGPSKSVPPGQSRGPKQVVRPEGAKVQRLDWTAKIAQFLISNPTYPKVQAVRKAKVAQLVAILGAAPIKGDVGPDGWNEHSLMKLLG